FPLPELRNAIRYLRPWRRAARGGTSGRPVPRGSAAAYGDSRKIRCRPAGGRDRTRRPPRANLSRHRHEGARATQGRKRRTCGAEDCDRGLSRASPPFSRERRAIASAARQSATHIRSKLANDFEIRSNSVDLPSRANICRRAVSKSKRSSRCAGSRMKLLAQPTTARRAPRVTAVTRWSEVAE